MTAVTPIRLIDRMRERGVVRQKNRALRATGYHALMIALTAVYLFPVVWALSMSFRTEKNMFDADQLIPHPVTFDHYENLFRALPDLGRYFMNTVTIATLGTLGVLITASMAGYALARLQFPGRSLYFVMVLLTLMVPAQTTLIPQYIIFRELGWTGSWLPLVAPAFFGLALGNALPTYFFRQFFLNLPRELEDAAAIDGASRARTFWSIIAPVSQPAYLAMGVLVFVQFYNSFFLNSVYAQRRDSWVLTQALQSLVGQYNSQYGEIMAGVSLVSLPIIVAYIFLQRWVIAGISLSGNAN